MTATALLEQEIAAAWDRAERLEEQGYELHWVAADGEAALHAELRTSEGTVLDVLGPEQALRVACGEPLAFALTA